MDTIRNEIIRATAQVELLVDKVRETRLRQFGHVQWETVGILVTTRKKTKSSAQYMDLVRKDMKVVEVRTKNAEEDYGICCGDS